MAGRLEGKVAVITGAASGIGAASARLFAEEGASVALGDINEAGLREVVQSIESDGGQAIGVMTDVRESAQIAALVEQAVRQFGRLDVIFANAGISVRNTVIDMPEEQFDQVIAINLRSSYLCAKYAIPHMLAQGSGSVIFTASELALKGTRGGAAYCASKAALLGMARAIARDHADQGVRVNSICPGPVDTPLLWGEKPDPAAYAANITNHMPIGRLGRPDEIARVALFLASDESSLITGTAIVADGGITA